MDNRLVSMKIVDKKLKQLEEVNEYWRNKTTDLMEENRRLEKEIQELKTINNTIRKENKKLFMELIDVLIS